MRLIPRPYQSQPAQPGGLSYRADAAACGRGLARKEPRIRRCEASEVGEVETVLAEMCHRLLAVAGPIPGSN